MALFRRHRPLDLTAHRRFPASLDVASGQVASVRRYDLSKRADVDALLKKQQTWQESAWYYVDEVGELKDALRFVENSFRRCRLFAGFQRDPDAEPIAVADAVAQDDEEAEDEAGNERSPLDYLTMEQADQADSILSSFAARDGGQQALLGRLGTNVFLVGEAYIVNRATGARLAPAGPGIPVEVEDTLDWEVRSREELRKSRTDSDTIELIDSPDQQAGIKLTSLDYVERLWRKHGRYSSWADSNVRAAIGTLEEIDLLNRLARASTRSRILAGILTMPDELDFGDDDQPMDGAAGRKSVGFDRELEEAMAAVVSSESDANSVAPLVLRGPADLLDAKYTRMIDIPRRYGPDEAAQYLEAVAKLGRTIELPLERLAGMEHINHWSMWMIDDDTYKAYIQPLVSIVAEGLLYGFLRPMLLDAGWSQDLVDKMVVAVDASKLIARPDRGKVATEGYGLDYPALSAEAWRKANSFGDDDAPSEDEIGRRLAYKAGIDMVTAGMVLAEEGLLPDEVIAQMQARQIPPPAPTGVPGEDGVPVPAGGEGELPHGPPAGPTVAVAASAGPSGAPVRRTLFRLGAIDRALTQRLQTAADAAMNRAQEKAGAKLRTFGMKHPASRDILRSRDISNEQVAAALGPVHVATLAAGGLLFAGMFEHLRVQWDAWVAAAQAEALAEAESFGPLSPSTRDLLTSRQSAARDVAWAWLVAALLVASDRVAAGTAERPTTGEQQPLLTVEPALIREALARAGGSADVLRIRSGGVTLPDGNPVGGVATGALTAVAFDAVGAPWVGYEWIHGDPAQPFEPHLALDGVQIADWQDPLLAAGGAWPQVAGYFPGDHAWCTCSFVPIAQLSDAQISEEAA